MEASISDPAKTPSMRLIVILLVIASILPLWAASRHYTSLNDDSYITLTYAKNIANGKGFVFNHPPAIQGTTTPLFAIIVAGLSLIFPFVSIPGLAVFFTAFCWAGISWCIYFFRTSWELLEWQAVVIGTVLILAFSWIDFLGMEAYLFSFLLVLSLCLFHGQRYFLAGLATGFLFLTRGEGVLVFLTLLIYQFFSRWTPGKGIDFQEIRPLLSIVAGFSLPVSIWFIYAHFIFGHFFPNTLSAKRAQGYFAPDTALLRQLFKKWIPSWGSPFRIGGLAVLNPWWIGVLIGIASAFIQKRRWLPFFIWILLYLMGYAALQVPGYEWYQLPIVFVLQIFFALGLIVCLQFLTAGKNRSRLKTGSAVCLLALTLLVLGNSTVRKIIDYPGYHRSDSYIKLCQWISRNTRPEESVAFIEIGYLGYYTDNRIIDLAGLILPDIVPHIARGDFAWGFWRYQPDYFIYLPAFDWALAGITSNPELGERYEPVAWVEGTESARFTIYKRKPDMAAGNPHDR